MAVTGIDILVDGLVLGIAFAAGAKAGILLTVALTIEVLFLGLTVANEPRRRRRIALEGRRRDRRAGPVAPRRSLARRPRRRDAVAVQGGSWLSA